jgi:hypothetical protein
MNALDWSIVAHRTVLVHYLDTATCQLQTHRRVQITWRDRKLCPSANKQGECNNSGMTVVLFNSPSRLSATAKPVHATVRGVKSP